MLQNLNRCYVETVEIAGLRTATQAMRNPKDSWNLNDSEFGIKIFEDDAVIVEGDEFDEAYYIPYFRIGEKDMRLMKGLTAAGPEHRKFNRMIYVSADMVLPRFIYQELDTYKVGTTCNSSSTMHRLLDNKNRISLNRFVYDEGDEDLMKNIVARLEAMRVSYLEAKEDKDYACMNDLIKRAKAILPEGFLLFRTMTFNYEVLRTIYHQRKGHRLTEFWADIFCKWVETLPYAKELIIND